MERIRHAWQYVQIKKTADGRIKVSKLAFLLPFWLLSKRELQFYKSQEQYCTVEDQQRHVAYLVSIIRKQRQPNNISQDKFEFKFFAFFVIVYGFVYPCRQQKESAYESY